MDKTIEPVNFNASQDLITHIDEMFDKLSKYNDQIVSLDIYLKSLTETPTKEKKIEVRVFLPGRDLYIDHQADSFVSAAQQTFDKLKRMLRKEKEKSKAHR
jgi:putative sigma-54 modulation protein